MASDPKQASHDADSAFPQKIKERKEEGKILSPSLLHQCATAWVVPQIAFPWASLHSQGEHPARALTQKMTRERTSHTSSQSPFFIDLWLYQGPGRPEAWGVTCGSEWQV